jgi:hypothetical protein
LNKSGRLCLLGHGTLLVWKAEGKHPHYVFIMPLSYCSICYLFIVIAENAEQTCKGKFFLLFIIYLFSQSQGSKM